MQEKLDKEKLLMYQQEMLLTVRKMQDLLNQYRQGISVIGSGSGVYASDNAHNVLSSFQQDYKKFSEFLETLTKVVEFLDPVALAYENLDKEISNQVASFPDVGEEQI